LNHGALTIGFIGGGHMATAMTRGLLRSGHRAGLIHVAEPDAAQRQRLAALDPGVRLTTDNQAVAATADLLVLAVKPQVLGSVAAALAQGPRKQGQLILSVAAGVTLASLAGWFGPDAPLVRAMPNQPATIGAGISALTAGSRVSLDQREAAAYVAASTGTVVWLDNENLMDAVTAVSGSGPAYFYLLMECMEQAALDLGLPPELAARLTRQTALGAARVVAETGGEPAALRAAVTSPGGTTAAALQVFSEAGLAELVRRALRAARDRGRELGQAAGTSATGN
jgi:pyrroline-5-carboxylate reductase